MEEKFKVGEVFSEISHYKVKGNFVTDDSILFEHLESGDTVSMSANYIDNYLVSGDKWDEEVKVTKEDKEDGTLGIRSIFEGIHDSTIFTVCFKKRDVAKSALKLNNEINKVVEELVSKIDKAKKDKKGVADAAKEIITNLIHSPILPYTPGEDRVLRGYKVQFESRDGLYNCVDVDIDNYVNIRSVNIRTIKWLIYKGVKYIVE